MSDQDLPVKKDRDAEIDDFIKATLDKSHAEFLAKLVEWVRAEYSMTRANARKTVLDAAKELNDDVPM